jgi:AraC-like DNA-binding protein
MLPAIRTATLTGYAGLARSLGLDPAALMAEVGLDVADLSAPDRWIPGAPVAQLLELSAERSGCEDFGLRLAEHRSLGTLGPLSVVLRDEPDLRSALRLLARYDGLYTGVLDLRLIEEDDLATLQLWLQFGAPVSTRQALDLTAAIVVGLVRALVRQDWTPFTTYFAHPTPIDPAPYHRTFGSRVRFDQEFTGMTFAAQDLAAPVTLSDPSVRPYSHQFLRTLLDHQPRTEAAQAREVIETMLPDGQPSIGKVASHLGVSARVLQQRLAAEHSTFSRLVHDTRKSLVERHLPNDRYSLTEISELLGFAAPSAFSRWFQQQFGTSPSDWRRSARDRGERSLPEPRPAAADERGRTVQPG